MKKTLSTICLLAAGVALADWTPVMLSLVTPVQAPSCDYDVKGFRLSLLYGDCMDFAGLDISVIGHADRDFSGIGIGAVNIADDKFLGAQVGAINWNINENVHWGRRSIGAQIGPVNYCEAFCGLQDGVVNVAGGSFCGLQSAPFNMTTDLQGMQVGWWFLLGVNVVSGEMSGCQIGLVNYAERVKGGLQIGFVNVIGENGWLPVLPLVNGHF